MKKIISLSRNSKHNISVNVLGKTSFQIFNYDTHAVICLTDNITGHWNKDNSYFFSGFKHSLKIGWLCLRQNCRFRVDWKYLFKRGHFTIRLPFLYLMRHNCNLEIGNNTFYISFDLYKIRRNKKERMYV